MMDEVIWGIDQFTCAYLDDMIVFSATWDDHLANVRTVLNRLSEVGLMTKRSKCQLAMEECTYLGHVIGNGVVKPETTKLQVRSFLGLTGYYRCFIPNYFTIAAPLTDLVRKHGPKRVRWLEGCKKSFCELKERLLTYPILRNVNFSLSFTLQVDASDAVLSQTDEEGMDHPILYFSRKLLPREKRYAVIEK